MTYSTANSTVCVKAATFFIMNYIKRNVRLKVHRIMMLGSRQVFLATKGINNAIQMPYYL